jgi:hypothetical protein
LELSGRELIFRQENIDAQGGVSLKLRSIKAGIYILEIRKGGQSVQKKLIIY